MREKIGQLLLGYQYDINRKTEVDANILRTPEEKKEFLENEKYGKIYACETDGMGNYSMIDDANIPSLLSIPYIGYADSDDEIYRNTRKFLLSCDNEFYFEGKAAKGIGSRHTPKNYVWHMALVMQGITARSREEKLEMLDMIVNSDADTGYLHESFDADSDSRVSRQTFATISVSS